MSKLISYILLSLMLLCCACSKKISPNSLDGRILEGSISEGTGEFEKSIDNNFNVAFSKNKYVIDGDKSNHGTFTYEQKSKNIALLTIHPQPKGNVLAVELTFASSSNGTYTAIDSSNAENTQKGYFRLK